jgi:hypothetical protein
MRTQLVLDRPRSDRSAQVLAISSLSNQAIKRCMWQSVPGINPLIQKYNWIRSLLP